jgi:hypothetical protein
MTTHEPAEPVYTFHITPSTPEARERIADGVENPVLLRGTLAQGRDLARLLDAPIDLLFGTGYTAFHIKRDGSLVCEETAAQKRLHVASVSLSFEFAYVGSESDARAHIEAALRDLGRDAQQLADVAVRQAAPDYVPIEVGDSTDRVFGAFDPRTGNPLSWEQVVAAEQQA